MAEDRQILVAIEQARSTGKPVALVTVVGVQGSAYQREGAKLVVEEDGDFTGLISGGCLEPEVAKSAVKVIRTDRPIRRRFDLQDETVWGLNLGCGGVIDVFIEPVGETRAWQAWLGALTEGRPLVRVLVHGSAQEALTVGEWILLVEGDVPVGRIENDILRETLIQRAEKLLASANSRSITEIIGGWEVLFDVNTPFPELFVFGAGRDVVPVVELAQRLGFAVTIIDPRQAYATQEHFPGTRIVLGCPEELAGQIQPKSHNYVVVMNHHLERDRAALRFALKNGADYVGVLGPLSRSQKLLDHLEKEGFKPTKKELDRLHHPIGLDIGAEGAEEIAVSILAEILAVHHGLGGGFLREQGEWKKSLTKV